jgi:hypothetical protein
MYIVLQDMKESTDENIREIAVEFEAFLEDQKRKGVAANEKFKEIIDYLLEVQGSHNLPEGMIKISV